MINLNLQDATSFHIGSFTVIPFICFTHLKKMTHQRRNQKRQISFNTKKEPRKTPPSSTANTSANKQQQQQMNVLMQDFAKTVENYEQLKKEMERIQKHGTRNFVVTNEFAKKMKEFCGNASALNALMPDCVNIQPIGERIQLVVKNCRDLFAKHKFGIDSTSIGLFGFKWHLKATTKEKDFLALHLHAKPPKDFTGNYRLKVDCCFSILNALDKDLIEKDTGRIYTDKDYNGCGFTKMAKFEDLLDPTQEFLTPEGDIKIWADFTIKSSTLNHLT